MKKSIVFICILLLAKGMMGQGILFLENRKWDEVLKLAVAEDKYVFMDCYTTWCGPCKALARDVFPQETVGRFFNTHFINVKYDMERGEGKIVHERYKKHIVGFPTLLLINKHGEVVHQMAGFQKAEALIAGMKSGMGENSLSALRREYEKGRRELDFLQRYVEALKQAFQKDEIKRVVDDYLSTLLLESLKKPEVWALVGEQIRDPYSRAFEYVVFNFDHYAYKMDVNGYLLERQLIYALERAMNSIVLFGKEGRELKQEKEKQEYLLKLVNRGNFKRSETIRATFLLHNLRFTENWATLLDRLEAYMAVKALGYSNGYVNETILYVASRTQERRIMEKCLEIMTYVQEKEDESGLIGANYYNTLAELHHILGNEEQARKQEASYNTRMKENEARFKAFMKKEGVTNAEEK